MGHEVHIEKMTFGGAALGRIDGKACFVRLAAPGDVVDVAVEKDKKSYFEASIGKLLRESTDRVAPPCPRFGECGGCTWQHLRYERQLAEKEGIFRETLWRMARVESDKIMPAVPAPDPWLYRSRIQLKVYHDGKRLQLGFFRSGSHYVTEIPVKCLIADQRLNQTIAELKDLLQEFPDPKRLPQIDLAIGERTGGTAIFHYIGHQLGIARDFIATIAGRLTCISGTLIQSGRKNALELVTGEGTYTYGVPDNAGSDYSLSVSAGGFSQINFQQNRSMVELLCEVADFQPQDRVLDLYCGNGNLSIPIAGISGEVVGIEDYAGSIADARRNAAANGIKNVEFMASDAATGVRKATSGGKMFDVVVLDPPRTGAADVVDLVTALRPSRIAYVSCDPMTLGRDLGRMVKSGYSVEKSIPIDMFPHTYHIESITLLNKQ